MKQGRTLAEVMQQVEKEAKAKRDLIVPAQSIFMGDEADWIGIYNKNSTERFAPNTLFHHQMASALNIPTKFYDYLAQTHPELLVSTVNTLVYDRKVNYMVRTMDYGSGMPTARAFLSERYRRVDNLEIATATLPLFAGLPDVEVVSSPHQNRQPSSGSRGEKGRYCAGWCGDFQLRGRTGSRVCAPSFVPPCLHQWHDTE